jgi:predicted transcriptional regulator
MTEIASRMGHTTAAATGLVDRLEKLGLVRRVHARRTGERFLYDPRRMDARWWRRCAATWWTTSCG